MTVKKTKVYYVNPRAWVDIPGIDLSDEEKAQMRFSHWTSDQAKQNEDQKVQGIFDFTKRHIFTEDTVISPVSQPAEPDKPDTPAEPEKPQNPEGKTPKQSKVVEQKKAKLAKTGATALPELLAFLTLSSIGGALMVSMRRRGN